MINYKDEITIHISEDMYEEVIHKLRHYLDLKSDGSIMDYILDFCDVNSYRIEDVAELISSDKELKYLLKQDCLFHKILTPKEPKETKVEKLEEW